MEISTSSKGWKKHLTRRTMKRPADVNRQGLTPFTALPIVVGLSAMSGLLQAQQISDPVVHYRGLDSDHGSSFLKWTADINGDGLPEIFLSLKKNHDEAVTAKQMPGWFVYIASTSGGGFTECEGIQESGDSDDVIGVGVVPDIDLNCCFVGLVTEIG